MSLTFSEKAHRYRLDKRPVKGATTLIGGGIPKPALVPWAARTVAEWVDRNPEEVDRLRSTGELVPTLSKVHDLIRDKAAMRGTEIHDLGQRYLAGDEVEIPEAHRPEVEGLVDFIEDLNLQPVVVEKSLANREHWYAGRVDFIGTSPKLHDGLPVMIDWKTSNRVYGDTALQCAAYARAEFWVEDDDPDTEHPMPEVVATYVAHITVSGVRLHPLATSRKQIDSQFQDFLAAAYIAKTVDKRKNYLGDPVWPQQEERA